MSRARHRHKRRRRTAAALATLGLALCVTATAAVLLRPGRGHLAPAGAQPASHLASVPSAGPSPATAPAQPNGVPFARAGGLRLLLPAADVVDVCYHQASYADAMTLRPFGHLERNANRWMFDRPADTPGPGYIVMSARGRSTSGTSAVDIVLKPGTPILAPVSGRVTKAKPYRLYDRYRDWRVEIAPDDQPQLRVVIIHLSGVRVRRGDRVSATLSVIGLPREFGFRSQVDDYVPGGDPHVHIEVKEPAAPGAP